MKLLIKSHKELRLVRKKNKTFYQHFVVSDKIDEEKVLKYRELNEILSTHTDFERLPIGERYAKAQVIKHLLDSLRHENLKTLAKVANDYIQMPGYGTNLAEIAMNYINDNQKSIEFVTFLRKLGHYDQNSKWQPLQTTSASSVEQLVVASWKSSSRNAISSLLQEMIGRKFNFKVHQYFASDMNKNVYEIAKDICSKDVDFMRNFDKVVEKNYRNAQRELESKPCQTVYESFKQYSRVLKDEHEEKQKRYDEISEKLEAMWQNVYEKFKEEFEQEIKKYDIDIKPYAEIFNVVEDIKDEKIFYLGGALTKRLKYATDNKEQTFLAKILLNFDAYTHEAREQSTPMIEKLRVLKSRLIDLETNIDIVNDYEKHNEPDNILIRALSGKVFYGRDLKHIYPDVNDDEKYIYLYRGVEKQYNSSAPLESWTSNKRVAKNFDGFTVLGKIIPIKNVYTFYDSKSWKRIRRQVDYEEEYIIINGGEKFNAR